ncbi:MAG: hypothetical protein WC764_02045 [Candidatus Paceibacterota bacterium]|jgi:hypothetical protein
MNELSPESAHDQESVEKNVKQIESLISMIIGVDMKELQALEINTLGHELSETEKQYKTDIVAHIKETRSLELTCRKLVEDFLITFPVDLGFINTVRHIISLSGKGDPTEDLATYVKDKQKVWNNKLDFELSGKQTITVDLDDNKKLLVENNGKSIFFSCAFEPAIYKLNTKVGPKEPIKIMTRNLTDADYAKIVETMRGLEGYIGGLFRNYWDLCKKTGSADAEKEKNDIGKEILLKTWNTHEAEIIIASMELLSQHLSEQSLH